jgi:hypothetical protein
MLDHLEETLCVYGIDVNLGLQSAYFRGPRHRLTGDAIRSELHQALVEGIEVTFVLNMDAFLNDRELLTAIELFSESGMVSLIVFITLALNIKVEVYWHDWEFRKSTTCFEMSVLWLFMAAQLSEYFFGRSYDRLSQSLKELDV